MFIVEVCSQSKCEVSDMRVSIVWERCQWYVGGGGAWRNV